MRLSDRHTMVVQQLEPYDLFTIVIDTYIFHNYNIKRNQKMYESLVPFRYME